MPAFIKGLELSGIFFREAVGPILAREFPGLRYGAGCLDYGSDLLGYDTERSMDHGWGPRVCIFVEPEGVAELREKIGSVMAAQLPLEVRGYPTNMGLHPDGTIYMEAVGAPPVNHRVTVASTAEYARDRLGLEWPGTLTAKDWLAIPQQRLALLRHGGIFCDGLGELGALRDALAWYPHDLWLHLMACQWEQIAQEEPFVARTGHVGDELGSKLITARLVKQLMQLCLLMERRYRPYSKWMGTAFSRLACAPRLAPLLDAALECGDWKERERKLSQAYGAMADLHNALGLTETLSNQVEAFHSRPYLVIHGGRFAEALRAQIASPEVKALPKGLGGIDQMTDNVDILENLGLCKKMVGVL